MSPTTPAHRAEFSVRCACGIEYHTSDVHVGKMLPCKCGRRVPIIRPATKQENQQRSASGIGSTAGSTASPEAKRRRKVRKRRYVAGEFWPRFGKPGVWIDRANGTVARWFASQLHPMVAGSFLVRSTAISSWLFLLGTIAAWLMLKFQSELTIPATVIAYGPRFVALWPFAVLVPASLLFLRRAMWLLALSALIVVGPIMGFRVSVGTLGETMTAVPAPGTLRILTFNTQSGNALSYDLAIMLKEAAPDVFTFQECGDKLWAVIEAQKEWFSKRYGSLCTGSRWEIEATDVMPRADLARISGLGFGGTGLVLRAFIKSPHGRLAVVNLHLETARKGLEDLLGPEGFVPDDNPFNRDTNNLNGASESDPSRISKAERFRRNALIRDTESERASRWAVSGIGNTPVLIAGDFNLPVESTIFQTHWGHFVDAFESRGNGLGWSKHEGRWLRMRIDHVLTVNGGLEPLVVNVVPDYRSDHRPVVADYAWPVGPVSKP